MRHLITFLKPTAMQWSPQCMLLMRLGMAVLIFWLGMHRELRPYEMDKDNAHSLAAVLPLMWMLQPAVLATLQMLAAASLAAFVLGWRPALSIVPSLLIGSALGCLRQSKGDWTHSTQILWMVLFAAWLAYVVQGGLRKQWKTVDAATHRMALAAAILMLSASYVASVVMKLKATQGAWISRVPSMSVQMVKSNLSDYYSKPTGNVADVYSEKTAAFFAEKPVLAKWVFGSGLFLELGALVMVLGRRWAFLGGTALCLMHVGISFLMEIEFWGQMGLLVVLCVLPGVAYFCRKTGACQLEESCQHEG